MPATVPKRIFVLMPFKDEFDDVYKVIKDACSGLEGVECTRCDEIERTGYITEHFLQEIRKADVIVADLTGSNPNVMYELGYADALNKPAILINQEEPTGSAFDVRTKRQIRYDRNRLSKDLQPKLISAIRVALGAPRPIKESEPTERPQAPPKPPSEALPPLLPSSKLTLQIATFEIKLEMARKNGDHATMTAVGQELMNMIERIQPGNNPHDENLRNVVGVIGNCAVEFELAEMFVQAEELWKRAIALCREHAGIHFQYADFLIDRSRFDDAQRELDMAIKLEPGDRRRQRLEAKLAIRKGAVSTDIEERLRAEWEADKGNRMKAAAYLTCLTSRQAPIEQFEKVCREWSAAAPSEYRNEGIRALADYLATQREYHRARELYEGMLPKLIGAERHDVLHNLATVCRHLDDIEAATRYWSEAYGMNPQDPTVQASFSQHLSKIGKYDLALKVLSGEPLPAEFRKK